jgi:hypothetical protein
MRGGDEKLSFARCGNQECRCATYQKAMLIIIVTLDQLFYSNFYALILSRAVRAIKAAGLISPVAHFLRCIRKK